METPKLLKVFNFESLVSYWMYQYFRGKIEQGILFKLLDPNPADKDQINNFEVIRRFNDINKSLFGKPLVFTRGFFVGIRVWLFGIQCKVFQKINENMDFVVISGIFGTQFLLQAGLASLFFDKFSFLVFLGIFAVQVILSFISTFVAGLYCLARESANDW